LGGFHEDINSGKAVVSKQVCKSLMSSVLIEAKLRVNVHIAFWSKSMLYRCQLQVTHQENTKVAENDFNQIVSGWANIPAYTLLTYWSQGGEFAGDQMADFWIIQADPDRPLQVIGRATNYNLKGQFEILAHGRDEKAIRLCQWWLEWAPSDGGQIIPIARWLGEQIKEEHKLPPPYPSPIISDELKKMPPFNPIKAWTFENISSDKRRFAGLYDE
jgi:hypothetical protein